MILVDSSVWISYFRDTDPALSDEINTILFDTCTCGIVFQEVLQGVKDDKEYKFTEDRLRWLPYLDADRATYLAAANIYRALRKKGETVLAADALIAAIALENNLQLYTLDSMHFGRIADFFHLLKLYRPGK